MAPNSVRRVGSSSRPVHHSPEVDFDQLPSPRPANKSAFSRRQSRADGRSHGPSRLSHSTVFPLPDQSSSDDDNIGGGFEPTYEQSPPRSPEHTSFTQMDQDEVDDGEEVQMKDPILSPLTVISKGKRKSAGDDTQDNTTSRHARHGRKSIPNGRGDEDEEAEEENVGRSNPKNRRKSRPGEAEDDDGAEEEIVQALNDVEMDVPEVDQEEEGEVHQSSKGADQRRRNLSDIAEEPEEHEHEHDQEKPAKKTKKSRKRDENTSEQPPPKKKSRTVIKGRERTPLADRTSEAHVVRLRSGEHPVFSILCSY